MIAIAVLLCVIIVKTSTGNISKQLPEPLFGQPTVITEQLNIDKNIIKMIVDDGTYMYVLTDADGYVLVYDLNGEYRHTLSFLKHMNGAFRLAQRDNRVYVCDVKNNLYVFEQGEFTDFILNEKGDELRKSLDFYAFSQRYELRGPSVWRIDTDPDMCVIERSPSSFIYQSNILGYVAVAAFFVLFIGIAVSYFVDKKRKNV